MKGTQKQAMLFERTAGVGRGSLNRTGLLSLRRDGLLQQAVAGKNVQTGKEMTQPVELRQHLFGNRQEIFPKLLRNLDKNNYYHTKYVRTTPGQILFNLLIQRSLGAR
jgi:hypothetical protein